MSLNSKVAKLGHYQLFRELKWLRRNQIKFVSYRVTNAKIKLEIKMTKTLKASPWTLLLHDFIAHPIQSEAHCGDQNAAWEEKRWIKLVVAAFEIKILIATSSSIATTTTTTTTATPKRSKFKFCPYKVGLVSERCKVQLNLEFLYQNE